MKREDRSKPPPDDVLVAHVVKDTLHRLRPGVVTVSAVMADVLPQLPQSVSRDRILSALVENAASLGFVIDFDERAP